MLTIHQLTKQFDGVRVLKGVDLTVNKGDVIAIIGQSGGGKTTLLRCMNFLETADSGEMEFDGERFDLAKISKKDIARLRRKTAFVFQNYNLFRNKTALQNVMLGLTVARKMPKVQAEQIARAALEKVGLADKADSYPNALSGGQQQRVAIARAIVTNPSLILADEPTGNLDSHTSEEIMEVFRELHSQGNTIVLITHDNDVARQAERIVHIRDGQLSEGAL